MAVLFLAGHGLNDPSHDYYFLPVDGDPGDLRSSALPETEIDRTMKHLAGKALFFLDTCHAGNVVAAGAQRREVDINGLVSQLASAGTGTVVFAASTGWQSSLEDPAWTNGAFTKALLEGLAGQASLVKHDGTITIDELDAWLAQRVKELTGGAQTPTTSKPPNVANYTITIAR